MKKLLFVILFFTIALVLTTNAMALTWYWGDNPNVTYTDTALSGEYRVFLPFTVISNGDNLAGAECDKSPYVNNVSNLSVTIDFNMGSYWGVYSGTNLIPNGLAISTMPGYSVLPDGIYTPENNSGDTIGLMLNYWAANDTGHSTLLQAAASNSFEIIIGDISQNNPVPEPATMMLFGLGLLGLAGVTRKQK